MKAVKLEGRVGNAIYSSPLPFLSFCRTRGDIYPSIVKAKQVNKSFPSKNKGKLLKKVQKQNKSFLKAKLALKGKVYK